MNNKFQRTLAKDLEDILSSNKTLIVADKMSQIYIPIVKKSFQTFCKKLLHQNIRKQIKTQQQI